MTGTHVRGQRHLSGLISSDRDRVLLSLGGRPKSCQAANQTGCGVPFRSAGGITRIGRLLRCAKLSSTSAS